jgi:glyoxylase-like metal-dependent hydrolase (beta-lactamase superfamily II)
MLKPLVCLLAGGLFIAPSVAPDGARATVTRAIDALGGRAALEGIRSLGIEAIGHDYFIDQSERPEGPFIVAYVSTSEQRDVAGGRTRVTKQQRFVLAPDWSPAGATIVDKDAAAMVAGERVVPAPRQVFEDGREKLELAPERLLLTALDAADLAAAPSVLLHGIPQHVVTFTWRGRHARLLIDAHDDVPSALEMTADDTLYGIWGLVRTTTSYSLWTLLPGGTRYPLQVDREWNGVSQSSATITKIVVNQQIDGAQLAIPDEVKKAFAASPTISGVSALKFDPAKATELAPGVTLVRGNWNVSFVRQPDGIVVIEAPIASSYSAAVLAEVEKRYPGARVKAVITTSDAWPHLGGVREYVARGIPIYACDLNRPILERLIKADYSAHPDALAKSPRPPKFTWVTEKTVIGSGDTRIEIYPAHGENGERMLFAYLPVFKLLYSSDDIQHDQTGAFFMPEYLYEVRDAVRKYGLTVDRIFGMHIGATPWSEIEAAIAKASASGGASAPPGQ